MHCPYCGSKESEVVETRESSDMDTIRRRRACLVCTKRFTTYERVEHVQLIVIKKDGKREQFSREKLRMGILKACEKTVVPAEMIERTVNEIARELRTMGSLEVKSELIGEMVAKRLKKLDKVAYIRFASVFKCFVDVEDFEKEVKQLNLNKRIEKQIV
ncbi:MAG: transcriptional regulator NrdR [Candidatus Levyibacteriota bacterium]